MQYQIQDPSGDMHIIEGPEGASPDQVLQQAQSLISQDKSLSGLAQNAMGEIKSAATPWPAQMAQTALTTGIQEVGKPISQIASDVGGGIIKGLTEPFQHPIDYGYKHPLAQAANVGMIGGGLMGEATPTEALENFAAKKDVQSLGINPKQLRGTTQDIVDLGNSAHDLGLTEGGIEDRTVLAQDLKNQAGAQVGEAGGSASPMQSLNDFLPSIHQLQQMRQASINTLGETRNPELALYDKAFDQMAKPELSYSDLQNLKEAAGDRAYDKNGVVKNEAAANVYKVYSDAQSRMAENAPELSEARQNYSQLSDMEQGLEGQRNLERSQGSFAKGVGMVGRMAGLLGTHPAVNATLAAGLGASGHGMMAIGALTPILMNPRAMSGIARSAANLGEMGTSVASAGAGGLMQRLMTNPQSFGKFSAPLLNAAKTGGTQGLAATHYLLSTQYPEYNDMTMQGSNSVRPSVDEGTK